MKVVQLSFEVHEGEEKDLVGYTLITGHLIFDIKLGKNFRQKARYVADGHKTDPPATIMHWSSLDNKTPPCLTVTGDSTDTLREMYIQY
jgi:hypothetical protein